MSTAWLGLGSNVNAENHIRAGIKELKEKFVNVRPFASLREYRRGF